MSTTALLLIFAFGGYEVVPVPAGEARDPRRAVPFALVMTIVIATAVMALAQMVALGTLPGLATSKTPLADAAALFLGGSGAALITAGAICSTSGNNMGQALSGSRNLYALAEQGDLPPFFGRIHPRFRTPVNAVLVTSAVSLVAGALGHVRGHGRGERDHPPARLRRDLRRHAPAPRPAVRGVGQAGGVRRPARADHPGCWRSLIARGDPGRA